MRDFILLIATHPLLLIVTVLNIALISLLTYFTLGKYSYTRVKDFVGSNYKRITDNVNDRRLLKNIRYYTKTISIKMSFLDKLDLEYVEKSNIRHILPFFNVYLLIALSIIVYVFSFIQIYKILYSVPASAAIGALFAFLPFIALNLVGRRNTEKVRSMISDFISVLKSWCAIKEDIIYAFEKSVEGDDLEEPLKTYIKEVVIQVKRGLDPQEALGLLKLKIDSAQFRDFVSNIEQTLKSRGDILALLSSMEDQFSAMEKERVRRKISNMSNRVYIFFAAVAVLIIGYYMFKSNSLAMSFYLETPTGKITLAVLAAMYFVAFLISLKISDFKY